MTTTTRPALTTLARGIKTAFPDIKTIYTQPSGRAGYHPSWNDCASGDYSKQSELDKPTGKPGYTDREACSALDGMCSGERLWGIASRLDKAMRDRDPRLFVNGVPIIREFYGQTRRGGPAKYGYSLFRRATVPTSDDHSGHFHVSIHRWASNDQTALAQLLGVITGVTASPLPVPPPVSEPKHVPVPVTVAQVIAGGKVTTGFGQPGGWAAKEHTGEDWNDPGQRDDTIVRSAVEGRVVFAGGTRTNDYGFYVEVEDAVGDRTRVCHMDQGSLKVKKGAYVLAGQPVGVEGETGNTTGPHVHCERRHAPYTYWDYERPQYDAMRPAERVLWASDLVPGSSNTSVYWLQLLLNSVSFEKGRNLRLDGLYGPNVVAEVKKFQAQKGIAGNPVDGDIGYKEIVKLAGLSKLDKINIKEK